MKRLLLPPLCAVVLAACNGGQAQTTGPGSAPLIQETNAASSLASPTAAPPPGATSTVATAAVPGAPTNTPMVVVSMKLPPELPAPVQEVIRLAQTTLGENVLVSYVNSIAEPFSLSADQLIYLNDLGVTDPVINALLTRAAALRSTLEVAAAPAPTNAPTADAPPAPALAPATPAQPGPATGTAYADVPGGAVPPPPVTYGQPQPGPTVVGSQPAPQSVAIAAPPAGGTVINYNTFYESLAPYGAWVEVADYGYCWRPTVAVVSSGWHPYLHNGSWAWSDYGWYWNSGYSWGWAPFHYGRWHRHSNIGWVWQPGRDWGPAWVNWSYTGDHCAWAPLPPECHWSAGVGFSWHRGGTRVSVGFGLGSSAWVGVGWSDFCQPRVWDRRVPHARVTEIVSKGTTTVVGDKNQVVNINGNNNTVIINNGAPYEKARAASRNEIRKVAIADVTAPGTPVGRLPGSTADRPVIAAYRPRLESTAAQPKAPPATLLNRQQEEARKTAAAPSAVASRPAIGSGPAQTPGARTEAPSRSRPVGSAVAPATASPTPGLPPSATRPAPSRATTGIVPSPSTRSPSAPYSAPSTAAPARTPAPANRPLIGPAPRPGETFANPQVSPRPAPSRPTQPTVTSPPSRTTAPSANPPSTPGARPNTTVNPPARPAPAQYPGASPTPSQYQSRSATSRLEERKAQRYDYGTVPGAAPRSVLRSAQVPLTPGVRPSPNYAVPAAPAPTVAPSRQAPAPRPTFNAPHPGGRSDFSAPSVRSAPSYSSPSPAARSQPAPGRGFSAPSATYSAPAPSRSAPAPTYATPAPARSAPTPTQASPAPSRPSAPGNNNRRDREN